MNNKAYKSFAYQFDPFNHTNLTGEIYDNIDTIISSNKPYWMHFRSPSKNLQQQLIKKLSMPKVVKTILFAEETRPRCMQTDHTLILVVQGIQQSYLDSGEEIPSVRIWLTANGLITVSTGQVDGIVDLQTDLETYKDLDASKCLVLLLEYLISYIEETTYELDEKLNKIEIETETNINYQATVDITSVRQHLVRLRRYLLPQRDASLLLAKKIDAYSENVGNAFKEVSESMIRQVETLEMLRERAVITQDNLTNQIGEVSNRRMYLLTVIMLIFTPAFFIMGLFSMYMPIPGMNSKFTWWIVSGVIVLLSAVLMIFFKKRKWL